MRLLPRKDSQVVMPLSTPMIFPAVPVTAKVTALLALATWTPEASATVALTYATSFKSVVMVEWSTLKTTLAAALVDVFGFAGVVVFHNPA